MLTGSALGAACYNPLLWRAEGKSSAMDTTSSAALRVPLASLPRKMGWQRCVGVGVAYGGCIGYDEEALFCASKENSDCTEEGVLSLPD